MRLTPDILTRLVRAAAMTRPDEIDCDACFEQVDRFAELHLAGRSPEEGMPLVHDHLQRCPDCRDEFEALLEALEAMAAW